MPTTTKDYDEGPSYRLIKSLVLLMHQGVERYAMHDCEKYKEWYRNHKQTNDKADFKAQLMESVVVERVQKSTWFL